LSTVTLNAAITSNAPVHVTHNAIADLLARTGVDHHSSLSVHWQPRTRARRIRDRGARSRLAAVLKRYEK
jgi:hypothetical protein